MKNRIIAITLSLNLLSGCASTLTSTKATLHEKPSLTLNQKEKWEYMVGKWYGEQPTKEGGKRQWLIERARNGTYKVTFREYKKDGTVSESSEAGQWAISGPVYMSIFRAYIHGNKIEPVAPSDPYNYDAYEILTLDKTTFKYKSYEYDATYVVRKVANDFAFPNE